MGTLPTQHLIVLGIWVQIYVRAELALSSPELQAGYDRVHI